MTHEDQGTGFDPGARGHELQGRRNDPRPSQCRFRLHDENKPYPRSSCDACKRDFTTMGNSCQELAAPTNVPRTGVGHSRLWDWFGLSYAAFLVMPRVFMHAMPDEWQGRLATLLEQYEAALPNQGHLPSPHVVVGGEVGKYRKWPAWLLNYRHPDRAEIDKCRGEPGGECRLTTLQIDILRSCNGEVVQLPYNAEQSIALSALIDADLLVSVLEDDQPTCLITEKGRAALRAVFSSHSPEADDATRR